MGYTCGADPYRRDTVGREGCPGYWRGLTSGLGTWGQSPGGPSCAGERGADIGVTRSGSEAQGTRCGVTPAWRARFGGDTIGTRGCFWGVGVSWGAFISVTRKEACGGDRRWALRARHTTAARAPVPPGPAPIRAPLWMPRTRESPSKGARRTGRPRAPPPPGDRVSPRHCPYRAPRASSCRRRGTAPKNSAPAPPPLPQAAASGGGVVRGQSEQRPGPAGRRGGSPWGGRGGWGGAPGSAPNTLQGAFLAQTPRILYTAANPRPSFPPPPVLSYWLLPSPALPLAPPGTRPAPNSPRQASPPARSHWLRRPVLQLVRSAVTLRAAAPRPPYASLLARGVVLPSRSRADWVPPCSLPIPAPRSC